MFLLENICETKVKFLVFETFFLFFFQKMAERKIF